MLVYGGQVLSSNEVGTDEVHAYDFEKDTWRRLWPPAAGEWPECVIQVPCTQKFPIQGKYCMLLWLPMKTQVQPASLHNCMCVAYS